MVLSAGQSVGPYEIVSTLGAGGMGEVYRAHDTKLKRDVALKILPVDVSDNPERLARFEREARVLASLNHPHIGAIYGVEEADRQRALVLELVEGPTLADQLTQGALSLKETLSTARQIAEALDAAHEKGIVHRDLKPANIKVTPDGIVKVLDFGIAKMRAPGEGVAEAPTVTTVGTRAGTLLGTAAYMSPEQARGQAVDKRTDIWAFGCLLYEMLTGRAAFAGETLSDTLARVLEREPEWSRLPSATPASVRRLLRRCLEKDPKQRLRDIGDAPLEVQETLASAPDGDRVTRTGPSRLALIGIAAVVLGALAVGVAAWRLRPAEARAVTRFSHVLAEEQSFADLSRPVIAISPDGSTVVFAGRNGLYRRTMAEWDAAPIRGTDGSPTTPFFSPDGQSVGYWDRAAQELRRIALSGGASVSLTRAPSVYGASWGSDDRIVYAQEDGIWRVSAAGGTPEHTVKIQAGELAYGPRMLPTGDTLMFTLVNRSSMLGQSTAWDQAEVILQSLATGERKTLVRGSDARILPTGHLVYALDTVVYASPFDLRTREVTGAPVPVIERAQRMVRGGGGQGGSANYDVSLQGTLAYVPWSTLQSSPANNRRLLAVDLDGRAEPLIDERREYWRPRISPDGTRVAVEVMDRDRLYQIWIVDLKQRTATPLTMRAENSYAVWSPDGQSVIYRGGLDGVRGIYRQPADGRGAPELIIPQQGNPTDASGEGIVTFHTSVSQGIYTLHVDDKKVSEFVVTPSREHMAALSPDGKWVAYTSNDSGQDEVYVLPYPRSGVAKLVSIGGGVGPVWAKDGSALYYRGSSGDLMAVPTTLRPTLTTGRPRPLFRFAGVYRPSGTAAAFDIHPDGRRFIMVSELENPETQPSRLNIVVNWFEELSRLVSTAR
jgi:eukaryotic-like serine/threonine-protein kinase